MKEKLIIVDTRVNGNGYDGRGVVVRLKLFFLIIILLIKSM